MGQDQTAIRESCMMGVQPSLTFVWPAVLWGQSSRHLHPVKLQGQCLHQDVSIHGTQG